MLSRALISARVWRFHRLAGSEVRADGRSLETERANTNRFQITLRDLQNVKVLTGTEIPEGREEREITFVRTVPAAVTRTLPRRAG